MSQTELQFSMKSYNQVGAVSSDGEGSDHGGKKLRRKLTVVPEQLKVGADSEDSEEYDN